MTDQLCPCLSGVEYTQCCAPLHNKVKTAQSAEQLMRSRYSAFVIGNISYLIATLHPSKRSTDDALKLQQTIDTTAWLGLNIKQHHQQSETAAEVEFIAFFEENPIGQLHENSRFIKEDGQWFYLDGQFLPPSKLGRNEPCFCGSGKKFKHCHA